jgi:hypothetical protein
MIRKLQILRNGKATKGKMGSCTTNYTTKILGEAVKKPHLQNEPENFSQLEALRAIIRTFLYIFLVQQNAPKIRQIGFFTASGLVLQLIVNPFEGITR